jgi:cytochrome b pre-mRNA-processing protein 3
MLGALRKLFIPKPPEAVGTTYIALVTAARNPFFFTALSVPDTIDGRFGLIVVHLFLLQHRLLNSPAVNEAMRSPTGEPEGSERGGAVAGAGRPPREAQEEFCRFLSEAFFADMDNSLRELGVADTGVSHRIKKMGRAYHGSLQAYTAGLADAQAMKSALARNLYGTVEQGDVTVLARMAQYISAASTALATADAATIMNGSYVWPEPAALTS